MLSEALVGRGGAAHADADAVLLEFCSVVVGSVLHTAIGMMHQSWLRPAMLQRDAQGFQRQRRFQAPLITNRQQFDDSRFAADQLRHQKRQEIKRAKAKAMGFELIPLQPAA